MHTTVASITSQHLTAKSNNRAMWFRGAFAGFAAAFLVTAIFVPVEPANAASAIASIDGHGDEVNGIAWNSSSVAVARKNAIASCQKTAREKKIAGTCKVIVEGEGPGYLSIVYGDDGEGYAYAGSQQEAVDAAHDNCTKTSKNCQDDHINTWEDTVAANGGGKQASGQCSPPTGRVVRSSTQCNNGDCIRRFDNGCTIHFRAAYCQDPFDHEWKWKPDGC